MSDAPPPFRIAVYQCAAGGLSPGERIAALSDKLGDLGPDRVDLVVCPELFMTGYDVGKDLERLAEPVDGPFAGAMARLAGTTGTAILYGYPEADGSRRYNAAACFGADGKLLANHRKLVLAPGFEARHFVPGETLTLFSLGGLRFAVLICYDAEFPEAVRAAARAGAQAVLVPTALRDRWTSVAFRMMPTRAFENGLYLVYANHAGSEGRTTYLGASCIVGPDGEDLARAGKGEEVIVAALEPERVDAARARLPYLDDLERLAPVTA